MPIDLQPVAIGAASELRVEFFGAQPAARDGSFVWIVAKFSGTYREEGSRDARFLLAMGNAAATLWEPDGMVLDLTGLRCDASEGMGSIADIGHQLHGNESLPLAVVVGPGCGRAIRERLSPGGTTALEPPDWVFDDRDSAWAYLEQEAAALGTRLFKRRRP